MPSPLAAEIIKCSLGDTGDVLFDDPDGLGRRIWKAHHFECSDVLELALEFGRRVTTEFLAGRLDRFPFQVLPAPNAWFEYSHAEWAVRSGDGVDSANNLRGLRAGYFMETEANCSGRGYLWHAVKAPAPSVEISSQYRHGLLCRLLGNFEIDEDAGIYFIPNGRGYSMPPNGIAILTCLIAIINQPKIARKIGHHPHRGLARLVSDSPAGKRWPLQAWHEITLFVDHSREHAPEHRGLTARKALHFVRTHYRMWGGELIPIAAHWRGDASLGICRGRYHVTHADASRALAPGPPSE